MRIDVLSDALLDHLTLDLAMPGKEKFRRQQQ